MPINSIPVIPSLDEKQSKKKKNVCVFSERWFHMRGTWHCDYIVIVNDATELPIINFAECVSQYLFFVFFLYLDFRKLHELLANESVDNFVIFCHFLFLRSHKAHNEHIHNIYSIFSSSFASIVGQFSVFVSFSFKFTSHKMHNNDSILFRSYEWFISITH